MSSSLDFLSCFIGVYFCFCASTTLSWCLQFGSIFWSQKELFCSFVFLSQDCFGYLGSFVQIVNFFVLVLVKTTTGSLIGIALSLHIVLSSIGIFIILIPPVQEHWVFDSFISAVQFLHAGPLSLYVGLLLSILLFLLQWWMGSFP